MYSKKREPDRLPVKRTRRFGLSPSGETSRSATAARTSWWIVPFNPDRSGSWDYLL